MARHFLVNLGSLSGSQVFITLSQLLVLPIVARYLDVAAFGDVALAMTVTVFAQLLSDAGLGRSLIRKNSFDAAEWSSVFWFLCLIGFGLGAALMLIAPLWAGLFDRPSVGPLIMALAMVPFLQSLSAVPTAVMERSKRFPVLATLRIVAAIAGFVIVVSLAMLGAGAWSLIAQQITLALVQCLGAVLLSGFRPLSPRKRLPLGDHIGFARNVLGVSLLMTAQRQIPMMMIGYAHGSAPLGQYSMSQRIQNLPLQGLAAPFARIAFVHMSAAQRDSARVADIYVRGVLLLGFVIIPPMALLAAIGETAFALLLSDTWIPAAMIFALAAPGIAIEASISHAGVLFQSMNQTGLQLRMGVERTLLRLILVAIALPFGVTAVAAALSVAALLFIPRQWQHVGRAVTLDLKAAYAALATPVAIGLLLWLAGRGLTAVTSGWATLVWAALLLLAVWAVAAVLLRQRLRDALAVFGR
ncbi:oligosaccharide flippase family protein [Salipiger sp. 1_MG-2023]|uniref:oligosaccharide flippase family protein n=1 Tax=Salipiger sp. 1_MG-2023 TaxID=3062665 RepID=UPI0026E38353|nr:oligosaccharide flippase family protein [Salipiger sp. 1_MG-2023]MDO6587041.1 oligosaccharide flippase family protein [Salipiger sp. 1_MG-2023]